MKKLMLGKVFAVAALFLCAVCAHAQTGTPLQVVMVPTPPSGSCFTPALDLDLSKGSLYSCSATWTIDPKTGLPLLVSSGVWSAVSGSVVTFPLAPSMGGLGTGTPCSVTNGIFRYNGTFILCDPNATLDGNGNAGFNSLTLTGTGGTVQTWTETSPPGAPASAGQDNFWVDSTTHLWSCINHTSGTCFNLTAIQVAETVTGITNASSPYSVLTADAVIRCDATSGNVSITLPAATGGKREIEAKKIDSSANTCTLARSGSDTIDGATSVVLSTQYASARIQDSASGVWDRMYQPQLGGDLSGSPQNATVAKINGNSVPSGAAAHQTLIATSANTYANKTIPDCQDSAGNHLNYTQSSDSYSCGTTSSGGSSVPNLTGNSAVNVVRVTSDFTTTSATLAPITGLSWTLPASTAATYFINCSFTYQDSSTSGSGVQFGVQDVTTAPTSADGRIQQDKDGSSFGSGTIAGLNTTAATSFGSNQPIITTPVEAYFSITVVQPSGSASVFQIMGEIAGGSTLTVKKGSACSLSATAN